MVSYVSEQLYVFLATLYGGIFIGFIYDLYRIFRCIFKPKKIATIIEDLIFWIVISIAAITVLLFSNEGQVRFYTFLGFMIGSILYNRILSKFVIKSMILLLRMIRKIILKIVKIILYPLRVLRKLFLKPWRWLKKKITQHYFRCKRICLLPKIVYNEMKKYIKFIRKKK
ncbi:spore cortex biosynthesis protein YabQ [Marinisporobacter balticus]|uniref:Spore cortex biosynthesis protein YabQ n=1 Tax=Marinisporobacter balticus TaxID=2018667 RepID=A0A4R2KCR3_9FIRM|nr:spore cortex biosynthesis protein YabQ [Marinisporobacter balticus]TCO71361.1 spore cortex biosynthesis protein YabQ [Marinisporobacter balticus]